MDLEALAITVQHGPVRALGPLDLRVAPGERWVVTGPAGSGKTTLLKCLAGLRLPTAGTVRWDGADVRTLDVVERRARQAALGMVFQSDALFDSLTVLDNVLLPLTRRGVRTAEARPRALEALAQVGLAEAAAKRPEALSGGMRKRAGIARAITMDPKVLFLDEPSAGLDPITAAGLDELLLKLRSALGLTMVVVTHELESAFAVAHAMLMLDRGNVLALGPADEVRRSADERIRRFFDRRPAADGSEGGQLIEELLR